MNLQDTIQLLAGGQGSGCHGDNCGRPSSGSKVAVKSPKTVTVKELKVALNDWKDFKGSNDQAASALRIMQNAIADAKQSGHAIKGIYDKSGRMLSFMMTSKTDASVFVDWLATHPKVITGEIPAHGLGTKMMIEAAKEAAQTSRYVKLYAATGAESFYEHLGMTVPGSFKAEYQWSPEDAKAFAKYGKVS